ncbi:MAG TPA: sulfatase [Methylomirabilota bacterium]
MEGAVVERPNIVLIVTDDQDLRSMMELRPPRAPLAGEPVMARTIARTPIEWENAVANNPLCGPSRATVWTGQRSVNHGVVTNTNPVGTLDMENLLPVWLQEGGYKTALVGKSINGYTSATPLPGWGTYFVMRLPDQYYEYQISHDGNLLHFGSEPHDYSTDILSEFACNFVQETAEPFFLQLCYNAPHAVSGIVPLQSTPAERHRLLWNGIGLTHPPSFNEEDVSDKPPQIQSLPLLDAQDVSQIDLARRRRYETLLAVDEGIEGLFAALEAMGKLSRTVVIFMSDNGFQYGEHRLVSVKAQRYEESVRIPMRAWVPWMAPETRWTPVSNVDIAPTIMSLAGLQGKPQFDGASLFSDLSARTGVHIERPGWVGWRTPLYKIVQENSGFVELYNLAAQGDGCHAPDPFELENSEALSCYRMLKQQLLDEL